MVTGKIDDDLRSANAESALERRYMKYAVKCSSGGGVKRDVNALQDDLVVKGLQGESDSAWKGEIEEGKATQKLPVNGYQAADDRDLRRVDDEALERYLRLSSSEGEPA